MTITDFITTTLDDLDNTGVPVAEPSRMGNSGNGADTGNQGVVGCDAERRESLRRNLSDRGREKKTMTRYRMSLYIPKDAILYTRDGVDAIVYWYTTQHGKLAGIAYHGKANTSDWHFTFRSEADRLKRSDAHLDAIAGHAKAMTERAEKRRAYRHTLQIGDIPKASWGYDQTNIDYYQVTAVVGPQTVELREIGSISRETGWLQGDCVPSPGHFIGNPMRKRVTEGNCVKFASYKYAWPVDKQTIPGVAGVAIYPTAHWTAYA